MVTCIGVSSLCVTLGWILSPVTGAPTSCTWILWRVRLAIHTMKDCFDICATLFSLIGEHLWLSAVFPLKQQCLLVHGLVPQHVPTLNAVLAFATSV